MDSSILHGDPDGRWHSEDRGWKTTLKHRRNLALVKDPFDALQVLKIKLYSVDLKSVE